MRRLRRPDPALPRPPTLALAALAALAAVAATGCARHVPGPAEVAARRAAAFDEALARARARVGADTSELTPDQVVVEAGGWGPLHGDDTTFTPPPRLEATVAGAGATDVFYRLADGRIAVAGPTCVQGSSCGCEIGIDYRYLRRGDGSVAVVRLTPDVEVVTVKVASCGGGCGQPPPPQPSVAAALPVTEPTALSIVDERYHYLVVHETCDHPQYAP